MDTLYDILGIVPASSHNEVVEAYQSGVRALLDGGDFKSSMWWWPNLEKIDEMTQAMKTLVHGDRRHDYNRKLMAQGIICSLCEGRGWNRMDGCLTERTCIACDGSGKSLLRYAEKG
jgi:DnaJ-class molecular chaperone